MKKVLVILLMLAYGFSSSGMSLNLHYCCGKLKSIEWTPVKEKTCGNDHKMGTKPCCESKEISNKQKADYQYSQFLFQCFKGLFTSFTPHVDAVVYLPFKKQLSPVAFAPPPLNSQPLFVLHCVYRI